MLVPVATVVLLLATVGVLALAVMSRARERALAQRVDLIVNAPSRAKPAAVRPAWQTRALDRLRAVFAVGMRHSWGVSLNPAYLLGVGVAAALVLWLAATLIVRLPGHTALVAAAAGLFLAPRWMLLAEQRRRAARFAELLPDTIDMVARVVRAGLPVAAAIRTVAQEAGPPASTVFAQVANQAEIGVPLDEALARTATAIGNPDFHFFAVAVALQQATGGNLAETLDTLSQIIRKRRALRLKAYAVTAEVRLSAVVLGAIPVFVTGALLMVAPGYLWPLFSDPRGNIILGLAIAGLVIAAIIMRGMIRHATAAA